MKKKKIFLLGDIHGRLKALKQVIERSRFNFEEDQLIFLGDIVDRGEEPFECISFLGKAKNKILICGNHDFNFYQYIRTGHDSFNGQHGSNLTKILWQGPDYEFQRKEIIDFLESQVEYFIDEQNNCFVHAGFDKKFLIEEQVGCGNLYWDRELIMQAMSCKGEQKLKTKNNFKEIFIGHTPTIMWNLKEETTIGGIILPKGEPITYPMNSGGVWNLDTGCGYPQGKLSMMNLETHEIFQSDLISDLYV